MPASIWRPSARRSRKQLDEYEAKGHRGESFKFSAKKYEIDRGDLAVVVFVQDDKTRHVLQAGYVDLGAPAGRVPPRKPTEASNNEAIVFDGGDGRVSRGGAAGSGGVEAAEPPRRTVKAGGAIPREAGGGGTGRLASLLVEADGGGSDSDAHLDCRRPALFARGRRCKPAIRR